jgi:predicted GH43/DUF377 family glycosyl hydrolase
MKRPFALIGSHRDPTHKGGRFRRHLPHVVLALIAAASPALAAEPSVAEPPVAEPAASDLFPDDLVRFTAYPENPVFTGRGDQFWDAAIRERGWIIREGDLWRMWYTGYDGTRAGRKKLGYATSADGLHWSRRGEPLYDRDWIEDVTVVRDGDTYYMFAEGQDDQAHWLTSPDGIAWTRQGRLDIRRTTGQPIGPGPYGTPVAWREGGTWYLLYERMDKGIWLATSKDLSIWTHVQDEPVMVPAPAEHGAIACDQVIKRGKRYYAYYHAIDDPQKRTWNSNIATSDDLVHWIRYADNPIVRDNQSSPILVDDGGRARLYTMHPQVNAHLYEPGEKHRAVPADSGSHSTHVFQLRRP